MAVIDPTGLLEGARLRKCSQEARLYWPYLYLLSNRYARIELDWQKIAAKFWSFPSPPSVENIRSLFGEYEKNHLILTYSDKGQQWGQWDTRQCHLPDYRNASDQRSPEPPAEHYEAWLTEQHGADWSEYDCREAALKGRKKRRQGKKQSRNSSVESGAPPELSGHSPQILGELGEIIPSSPHGEGVGDGDGDGKGKADEPLNSSEAARAGLEAWNMAGRHSHDIIRDAIENACRDRQLNPEQAIEWLIAERTAYESAKGDYAEGIQKWLSSGTWSRWRGKTPKKPFGYKDAWTREHEQLVAAKKAEEESE